MFIQENTVEVSIAKYTKKVEEKTAKEFQELINSIFAKASVKGHSITYQNEIDTHLNPELWVNFSKEFTLVINDDCFVPEVPNVHQTILYRKGAEVVNSTDYKGDILVALKTLDTLIEIESYDEF